MSDPENENRQWIDGEFRLYDIQPDGTQVLRECLDGTGKKVKGHAALVGKTMAEIEAARPKRKGPDNGDEAEA